MKILKRVPSLLAGLLLCLSSAALPAYAETVSQDGLQVTLDTDKGTYNSNEQIKVELSVKNNNPYEVRDVMLESVEMPEYSLAQGSKNTRSVDILSAGETVLLDAVYSARNAGNSANNSNLSNVSTKSDTATAKTTSNQNTVNSPKTGDDENIVLLCTVVGISALIGMIILMKSNNKKAKKILSLLLAVSMVDSAVKANAFLIKAADTQKMILIERTVSVNGNDIVVQGKICYTPSTNDKEIPDAVIEGSKSTKDSDNDGLTDYQEYCLTNTDPYKYSTADNDVKDSDRDEDNDGLSNIEEIRLGTCPLKSDTDNDGLSDKQECTLGTDPLLADTDGDDASDGWETENGFNPLEYNSEFDVKKTAGSDKVVASVSLKGKGTQAANLKVSESDNILLNNKLPGYVGPAFDFETVGTIDSAQIGFQFDASKLNDNNFAPAIYYFNKSTQQLEELPTTVEGNKAYTTVTHFSTYILLNKKDVDQVWKEDIKKPAQQIENNGVSISFVLDRSYSMEWNDPDNLRNSLTTQFINKLSPDTDMGSAVSFTAKAQVLAALTKNKETLKTAVNSIENDDGFSLNSGTNGSNGIYEALQQLKADMSGNNRYILFMTDGEDNKPGYSYDSLIQSAKENNITIYSIGLGTVNSDILKKLASQTGGKYYYASNADELLIGYQQAEQETIDYHTDSNNDGISDYYTKLLCEGKLVSGTGLKVFNGCSYDEVQKNADFDGDGLKNGDEIVIVQKDGKVFFRFISSPESADTDEDGILDNEDTAPLEKGLEGGVIGELTIVSCHPNDQGFTGGHSWLVYKSYVKDDIDVSGLLGGYTYNYDSKGFEGNAIDNYPIKRNCYLGMGNAGTEGTSGALSTVSGSCGGILYNREFYGAWADNNFYIDVAAYSRKITQSQFEKVMTYCTDNSYYNLYSHNCSSVASEAWQAAYGTDDGFYAKKSGIHGAYSMFDTPATLKENILAKSDADTDYRSTMLDIINNWE